MRFGDQRQLYHKRPPCARAARAIVAAKKKFPIWFDNKYSEPYTYINYH